MSDADRADHEDQVVQVVTTLLELVGAALMCLGVFWFNTGAGLIVTGAVLIGLGYLGGRQ